MNFFYLVDKNIFDSTICMSKCLRDVLHLRNGPRYSNYVFQAAENTLKNVNFIHNLSRMSFEVPYNLTTNVDNVRHGVDEYVLF